MANILKSILGWNIGCCTEPLGPACLVAAECSLLLGAKCLSISLNSSIMLGSARTTKTFPGNLLREQSGEMAAQPLLINLPLKFQRVLLIIEGLMLRPSCAPQFLTGTWCRYLTAGCGMHSLAAPLAASASVEEKGTNWLYWKRQEGTKSKCLQTFHLAAMKGKNCLGNCGAGQLFP